MATFESIKEQVKSIEFVAELVESEHLRSSYTLVGRLSSDPGRDVLAALLEPVSRISVYLNEMPRFYWIQYLVDGDERRGVANVSLTKP